MAKVIDELRFGEYLLLKIDKMPISPYNNVVIDGCKYDFVPSYDLGEYSVAVNSPKTLKNKDIEFVMQW